MQNDLITPTKINFNIRPIKHAYFIKQNDVQAFCEIVRLSTTQWGGINNLIIPVKANSSWLPIFTQLMQFLEPDKFVSFIYSADTHESTNKIQANLQKIFPDRQISVENGRFYKEHDPSLHSINAIPKERQTGPLFSPKFMKAGNIKLKSLELALFGEIYPDQEYFYQDNLKTEVLKIDINSEKFWLEQIKNNLTSSPLNLTSYGIRAKKIEGIDFLFESSTFYIVYVDSFMSLLFYWNLRANQESLRFQRGDADGRRIILLPKKLIKNTELINDLFKLIRSRLTPSTHRSNLDLVFAVWNKKSLLEIKNIISKFSYLEKLTDGIKISFTNRQTAQPDNRDEKKKDRLTYLITPPWYFPRKYTEGIGRTTPININLKTGINEVLHHPPSEFSNPHLSAVAFDLEGDFWNDIPSSRKTSLAINQNGWFSRYGYTYIATISQNPSYINFQIPSEQESIRFFMESHGFNIRNTKVTTYSNAFINLIGGLESVNKIASKHAYELLSILAVKNTKKIAQYISKMVESKPLTDAINSIETNNELRGNIRTFHQLLSDKRLRLKKEELLELIEILSKNNTLIRGYYVECPNCGYAAWHPINALAEKIKCDGCFFEFPLPIKENSTQEILWRYRLNSLVNQVVDQDILPGVLAISQLAKNTQLSCQTFGVELIKGKEAIAEFDFLFTRNKEMFGGECKSGTKLTNKDFQLAQIGATLNFSGFFFCTPQDFDNETKENIEQLKATLIRKKSRMKIITLNESELFSEKPLNIWNEFNL